MLLFGVLAVKLISEVALMALLGRGVLALLAGAQRDRNLFYQLLQLLTRPFERAVRAVMPRVLIERHVPLATFVLLGLVWLGFTVVKIALCLELGSPACRG